MARNARSVAPAPPKRISKDERQQAVVNARALWALLDGKIRAKEMRLEQTERGTVGSFRGEPGAVSITDLEKHFAGEISLGIMVVNNDRTRLLGFDLDERAAIRTRILGDVLNDAGFANAMIATTGSDDDRAKIVVFFERSQSATAANRLAYDLLERARRNAEWGIEDSRRSKVAEIRPCLGDGGVLRIGGRHAVRGTRLERFFNPVTGEVAFLSNVRPSSAQLELEPETILVAPQQAWVLKWIENGRGWTEGGAWAKSGTVKVNADLMRLAFEAYRLRGPAGQELFRGWVGTIFDASPQLHGASPSTGDKRPVMGWDRRARSAWVHVLKTKAQEKRRATLLSPPPSFAGCVVWQQRLKSFDEFLDKRGCNYVAFQVSYRELARFWGCDPKTAWRQVQDFTLADAVVIIDPGTQGSKGDKTIYALPRHGVEQAYRLAESHHMVIARRLKQAKYAAFKAEQDLEIAERRKPVSIEERRDRRKVERKVSVDVAVASSSVDDMLDVEETSTPAVVQPPASTRKFIARSSRDVAVLADATADELMAYARSRGLFRGG